jgi:hypothetical protein
MPHFTVRQGKRYLAEISLSWWEAVAGNDTVAKKIADVVSPKSKCVAEAASARRMRFGRSRTQPRKFRVRSRRSWRSPDAHD